MPAVVALTSSHVPTLPTDWNATVHIYAVDGVTPATVYADANGNTTGANPLPRVRGTEFGIDGTGYWLCYVTAGSYVVSVTVPGGSPQTHSVTVAADVDPAPVPDYDPSGAAAAETGRATAAEAVNATAITAETARATAAEALKVAKAGDTMTGDLAMGGHRVTGLADPSGNQDAATKAHVAAQIVALVGGAPGILDTLGEIATALQSDESVAAALATTVANETTRAVAAEALAALKSANLSDLASATAARSSLGLGNVDNTSDVNKPVSTAQATADTAARTAAQSFATAAIATQHTADNGSYPSFAITDVYAAVYGVKADGVTDDTAALRSAILAAGSNRKLKLPPGAILVTDTLLSAADIPAMSAYSWEGQRTERTAATVTPRGGTAATTIMFRPVDTTKWLVNVSDTNSTDVSSGDSIGPFEHNYISFDFGDANGCNFGDPGTSHNGQTFVTAARFSNGRALATPANQASDANGVMTRSGRKMIAMFNTFEAKLDDFDLVGGDTQIYTLGCDHPSFRHVRSLRSQVPFDINGDASFAVQHTLDDVQIEGWGICPLKINACEVAATKLRFEQSGSPAGSGRFALPQTAAVTAGSGIIVFSGDMTNVLFPQLSVIELTDGTNVLDALVTAVAGTSVTIDTTSTVVTWTAAAATVTRIHGMGPLISGGLGATFTDPSCAPYTNAPAFVYVMGTAAMKVSGAMPTLGGYGAINSLIIGNRHVGPSAMNGGVTFDACSPLVLPLGGHPFATVTNQRDGLGAGNADLAHTRARFGGIDHDSAQVARRWAFTPRSSGSTKTNSYQLPVVKTAGEANTSQSIWSWYLQAGASQGLSLLDETLPQDSTVKLRIRVRAIADSAGPATLSYQFTGNGAGSSGTLAVTNTWKTFDLLVAVPSQWQGVRNSPTYGTSLSFTADPAIGVKVAGVLVEEILPTDPLFALPARALSAVTAPVTVNNSSAETTLAQFAIPTSTAAGDAYKLRLAGTLFNNSAGSIQFSFRAYVGATVVLNTGSAVSFAANASTRQWDIDLDLIIAATNDERLIGVLRTDNVGSAWAPVSATYLGTGSAAQDLTTSKNLKITVQMNVADANGTVVMNEAVLTAIPTSAAI